jgi:signal peptidase II
VAGLAVWSVVTPNGREGMALSLILGGAVGNLIDRIRDGMVTDFIDLHAAGHHWPTFNLADIAITLGAAWLVLDAFRPAPVNAGR